MFGKRAKRGQPKGLAELVGEADALVRGDYVEYLILAGRAVPGWAWVNPLAHCSASKLALMASRQSSGIDQQGWGGVLCALANELIRQGRTASGIARLQHGALVPFELALLGGSISPPANPGELRESVQAILEHGRLQGS